jgi:hypothetical protein
MLKLCSQKCDQCLFTPNRIVSAERMNDIIDQCKADGDFFICHKSPTGDKWICRGFYDNINTDDVLLMKAYPQMLPVIDPKY